MAQYLPTEARSYVFCEDIPWFTETDDLDSSVIGCYHESAESDTQFF
jgi:hypothetical protein